MNNMKHKMKWGILFVPLFIGGLFLFTWAVMLLWNAVLPAAIPAIHAIGFWQSMGILALSKILFGFGMGRGGKRRQWGHRMDEKWTGMTEEDREKIKSKFYKNCSNRWKADQQDIPAAE